MNNTTLSLQEKAEFIINYMNHTFSIDKLEIETKFKDKNFYTVHITFDNDILIFNLAFCSLNDYPNIDKMIVLKPYSETELEELIQLIKKNPFNRYIPNSYSLQVLKNNNEIIQMITSFVDKKVDLALFDNIKYSKESIELLYELTLVKQNMNNF